MKRMAFHKFGLAVLLAVGIVAGLSCTTTPAWAQDPNVGDSPDHGVARLSFVQGNVSIRHGDMGELAPAAMNAPLVTTDRVVTGDGGTAEVQFDFTNMIRLGISTEVRLSQLEYKRYQVQIAQGITMFHVLRDNDAQVEISTPAVSVRPVQAGTYRIAVRPDGITEITVRGGSAEIYGPRGSEVVSTGQTMQVRGTADDPEFQVVSAIPLDEFDRWNIDRDKVMQQTSSYRPGYVPPDVAGGESLDPYGQWQNDPNYGQVWVPQEPVGWAPYQDGRWVDLDYYGWTWVGAEPWGWAPYHYGNWYMSPYGWAWYPGGIGLHHYWRPAMVGFFGWGAPGFGVGIGVGFGFGHIGWVPLAPFEAYHPWYGVGAGRFGVGANLGVANTFRNARINGGISSMSAANFGRTSVNGTSMARPTGADLARAGAIHGALPVQATAASHRMSDAAVNTRGMPQTSSNARFATRATMPNGGANASRNGSTAPVWHSLNGNNPGAQGARPGGTAQGGQSNYRYNNGAPASSQQGTSQQHPYATSAQPNRAPAQQQPLRMNAPIVQERGSSSGSYAGRAAPAPAPRSGGGGAPSRGGGGGGGHGGGHR